MLYQTRRSILIWLTVFHIRADHTLPGTESAKLTVSTAAS
jgi:hypothetical protein